VIQGQENRLCHVVTTTGILVALHPPQGTSISYQEEDLKIFLEKPLVKGTVLIFYT